MNNIFTNNYDNLLYSPMISIYPSRVNLYTPFIEQIAKIFFQILENSKMEYYVFAGSSIGLIRNNKSIPWVDDYDILIFEKDINKLEKILEIFKKNFFKVRKVERNKRNSKEKILVGYVIASPRYKINNTKTSFFHCDIFLSKNENGIVKNLYGWGLYDRKNINYSLVYPQNYKQLDDLNIPFFNNYETDVSIEYGDVINKSIIHISHGREKVIINKKWVDVYNEFDEIKTIAINNTKKLINFNDIQKKTSCDILTDQSCTNYIDLLTYISTNISEYNKHNINIYNLGNVRFILDIKYYFPDIKVNVFIKNKASLENVRFFIDFIDNITVLNKNSYLEIENFLNSIVLINKPIIKLSIDNSVLLINSKIKTEDYIVDTFKNNNGVILFKTPPILKIKPIEKKEEIPKKAPIKIKKI